MGTICLLTYNDDDLYCHGTNSFIEKQIILPLGSIQICKIKLCQLPLLPGKYFFTISAHDQQAIELDTIENAVKFQMFSNKGEEGIVRINSEWLMEGLGE